MSGTGRWARLALPLLTLFSILACTLGAPAPTRAPLPDNPTRPPAGLIAAPLGGAAVEVALPEAVPFAAYGPAEADVDGALGWLGLPELADLANPADLWPLNQAQRAQLEEVGFVVAPAPAPVREIYRAAAADGRPLFLSADLALQACVRLYANTWQGTVLPQLAADVAALVQTMRQATEAQWAQLEGAQDPAGRSVAEAARRNLAFLSVAQRILDPSLAPHPAVAQVVAEEWTLVNRAEGEFASPISGARVDYRPFGELPVALAPDDPLLPAYRVLQWFQLQPLPLSGAPGEMRQRVQRMLLYLLALEQSENGSRWERLDGTLRYLWGGSYSFSLAEVTSVAAAVYGRVPDADALTDADQLDNFIRTADAQGMGELRLFHVGAGPLPDHAAIFESLTFNRVGGYLGPAPEPLPVTAAETAAGVIRTVPRVLDVAAVHGSTAARQIMDADGDTAYESYETQFERERAAVEKRPVPDRTATFSGGWHYALQPLLEPPLAAGPAFMRDDRWDQSRLYGWQAAWTAGQWHAADLDRPPGEVVPAVDIYLEPQPILYARLAALTRQQAAGLAAQGLLPEDAAARFAALADLLDDLSAISADERQSTFWRPSNSARLQAALELLLATDMALPHVVDLYEASADGRVLQAAVGGFYPIYVLAPWDTEQRVFAGAVWASFEVVREREKRLTIEQWSALDAAWPDRPAWSDTFIVE